MSKRRHIANDVSSWVFIVAADKLQSYKRSGAVKWSNGQIAESEYQIDSKVTICGAVFTRCEAMIIARVLAFAMPGEKEGRMEKRVNRINQ